MPPRAEREVDPAWQHCTPVPGTKNRKVICSYCKKEMSSGVSRLKEHLAGIGPDVTKCPNCPLEVQKEMKAIVIAKRKQKAEEQLKKKHLVEELGRAPFAGSVGDDDDSDADENETDYQRDLRRAMQASRRHAAEEEARMRAEEEAAQFTGRRPPRSRSMHIRGEGPSGAGDVPRSASMRVPGSSDTQPAIRIRDPSGDVTVGPMDPYLMRSRTYKQPTLKSAIQGIKEVKKKVGRAISKWFISSHIPAAAASSPYFQSMIDHIAEAGPGVKGPSPYEILNTYLNMEVDELKTYISTFRSF